MSVSDNNQVAIGGLTNNFVLDDFSPEKFVRRLGSQCIGADELRYQRAKIQELANNTSIRLKRNVYQNYIQFIETAKEILHLESEMYQLAQMLGEQRSLLGNLGTIRHSRIFFNSNMDFIIQNSVPEDQSLVVENKKKLMQILQNVEGAHNLTQSTSRICIHEGSLLEIDTSDARPLSRIHAYLFNDSLMIALRITDANRRNIFKYKMQAVYDLQSLAIVNIRDLGNTKLALKLLTLSDVRTFQCPTATNKKEWLEKWEYTKSLQIPHNNQKSVFPITTPFSCEKISGVRTELANSTNKLHPEWLLEINDDLDSCMAQRHFEAAHCLIEKAKIFLNQSCTTKQLVDLEENITNRTNLLVISLTKELESRAETKSLQGSGLRSARRAIKILIRLDRSAQACQLYLRLCSTALKTRLRKVKREGPNIPYIKQLSAIAFSNIVEMSKEFLRLFPDATNCNSALILWNSHEIKHLTSHLIKQLFIPQISLSTLAECIAAIRSHCEQLTHIGINFRYQLDGHLRNPLNRSLQDMGEKYMDIIKIRATEDTWLPTNLGSNRNIRRLISELDSLGIPLLDLQITNRHWIQLTSNTLNFSKLYAGLVEDCLSIANADLISTIEDLLILILRPQIQHLSSSLNNPDLKYEKLIICDNIAYIRDVVIVRSLELYKIVTGKEFTRLMNVQKSIYFQSFISTKPMPAPRTSVPKYSATDYV